MQQVISTLCLQMTNPALNNNYGLVLAVNDFPNDRSAGFSARADGADFFYFIPSIDLDVSAFYTYPDRTEQVYKYDVIDNSNFNHNSFFVRDTGFDFVFRGQNGTSANPGTQRNMLLNDNLTLNIDDILVTNGVDTDNSATTLLGLDGSNKVVGITSVSKSHTHAFVSGDWVLSGANRILTIPAATHGLSAPYDFNIQGWEDLTTHFSAGFNFNDIRVLTNGDIELEVNDGSEFNGKVKIIK